MRRILGAVSFICCTLLPFAPLTAQETHPFQDLSFAKAIKNGEFQEFDDLSIFLEQNITDQDGEVVIELTGGDEGLQRLWMIGPDGRTMNSFKARNGTIGGREFLIESPEPDLGSVLAAFPEGEYLFIARTFAGDWLVGFDELTHDLPPAADIIFPPEDSTVPAGSLEITWDPVAGSEIYVVELDNEDLDISSNFEVPGDLTAVSAPPQLVLAGNEYKVGVGTFNEDGNLTIAEVTFHTEAP